MQDTKEAFLEAGIVIDFIQDNHSLSVEPGVLRGMHYQTNPKAQTKLVRATTGVIMTYWWTCVLVLLLTANGKAIF